jgi:NADPH:quinone reductase-like Zn-dependent oxidoreductase
MRSVVRERYGIDELRIREVPVPELPDDGVLVRVRASSVNRAEWYAARGVPYFGRPAMGLVRPRSAVIGTDFAGTVEAVGKDVDHVRPGDDVFGGRTGAYAEYVCVRVAVVPKPVNLSFEEAAAVPTAAITALQGLRDKAGVRAGHRVLVNGASGGVGTFALQIAKALGADVTAVCSTRNVEQSRDLGADRVVDYTREDFTRDGERYDVVFDVAGSHPWRHVRRVLTPDGVLIQVGAPMGGPLLGPLPHLGATQLAARASRRKATFFIAKFNRPDMETLRQLIEDGKVRPVVERVYPIPDVADALRHVGEGHARGKVVLTI